MSKKKISIANSKLLKMKEWVTLEKAAQYISALLDEEVSVADVLLFGLDGHLRLSVNIGYAKAKKAEFCNEHELSMKLSEMLNNIDFTCSPEDVLPLLGKHGLPGGKYIYIENNKFLEIQEDVVSLDGLWDLPMIGAEKMAVLAHIELLSEESTIPFNFLEGTFIENGEGEMWQIQRTIQGREYPIECWEPLKNMMKKITLHKNRDQNIEELFEQYKKTTVGDNTQEFYWPNPSLPEESALVVSSRALMKFEKNVARLKEGGALSPREKRTYHNIIAALLEIILGKSPGIGSKHPDFNTEGEIIEHLKSFELPGLSKSTLENKFRDAKRTFSSN